MNTLESFLAPSRVSDWMACAHVRRCPNWQCWWDEDSVVAASGLTEDDERNLQADKMRSKARARKLAKSKCSFPLSLSFALSRRLRKLLRLYMSLSFVISLKRGGGHSLSRVNSSGKERDPAPGCLLAVPRMSRAWLRWFPASRRFMCDEKRRWCLGWLRSSYSHSRPEKKKKKKERKKQSLSVLKLAVIFFWYGGRHGASTGFLKVTRKVVETEGNFL